IQTSTVTMSSNSRLLDGRRAPDGSQKTSFAGSFPLLIPRLLFSSAVHHRWSINWRSPSKDWAIQSRRSSCRKLVWVSLVHAQEILDNLPQIPLVDTPARCGVHSLFSSGVNRVLMMLTGVSAPMLWEKGRTGSRRTAPGSFVRDD